MAGSGRPIGHALYASINGLHGTVKYPSWMKRIWRVILHTIFVAVRVVVCNVIFGIVETLGLVWSKAEILRGVILPCVGMRAVETGAIAKAKRFAEELIHLSRKYKDDRNFPYGNAIHKGNLILGRIALREGNIEAAKQYLVYAGETPGSPQLDSFGPNMILAKELLEAGEKDAVLDYFKLCSNFWVMGPGKLRYWAEIVQSGKIPNFGSHLLY